MSDPTNPTPAPTILGNDPMTTLLGLLHGGAAMAIGFALAVIWIKGNLDPNTMGILIALLTGNQVVSAAGHILSKDAGTKG